MDCLVARGAFVEGCASKNETRVSISGVQLPAADSYMILTVGEISAELQANSNIDDDKEPAWIYNRLQCWLQG